MRTSSAPATHPVSDAYALRAEARVLATAGIILLACGFPLTIALAWMALSPELGLSPVLPVAAGGAPLTLGYLACSFASRQMARAKALEG
jgi:hypothetical protein